VGNILKPDKPRLVFNAASKFKNVCLNDALHNGQLLMTDMLDALFHFRKSVRSQHGYQQNVFISTHPARRPISVQILLATTW
jgi:hypothetical protein